MKMTENAIFRTLLLLALLISGGCRDAAETVPTETPPSAVVALSPALTETVYALGQESSLVGVSQYSNYPSAAASKPCVGTVFVPNWEAILRLKPDCVLVPENALDARRDGEALGLRVVALPQNSLEDVFRTVARLGELYGCQPRAEALCGTLRERLDALAIPKSRPRRVLLVLSRDYASAELAGVYIAGQDALCEPLLAKIGLENAYCGNLPYPTLGREALVRLDPDLVLETVPGEVREAMTDAELLRAWEALPEMRAVREGDVLFLDPNPPLLPSPALVEWAVKISQLNQSR